MSAPVGPTGLVTMCNGEEHEPFRWHAALNYGTFRTDLHFSGQMDARVQEHAVTAALEYRPGGRVSFQVGAGAVLGGWIQARGLLYPITPGWVYSAAVSVRLLDGTGYLPFVLASASASVSSAGAHEPQVYGDSVRMISTDLRAGLTVGKTFWNTLTPYATARVFGGPIFWQLRGQQIVGNDAYHYQVGAGAVLNVFTRVDFYAEVAFLGEQRVSAGAGVAF